MINLINNWKKNSFLFEELVKRDFKQKYKRTILGMGWSVISPLLHLLVLSLVFTQFFGKDIPHYTIYLFCGNLVFLYYKEATNGGMNSLTSNGKIFSKVNVPKYLFLLSKNVSSFINFCITLLVFFVFVIFDGIQIEWHFLLLLFPIICLVVFNIGVGLILSALYIFFKDIKYLYDVFTLLLHYMCAIFYTVDSFPAQAQKLFLLNPIYCYIKYFRLIVIDGVIPSMQYHVLCLGYAIVMLLIGGYMYKKYNHKFLYYV